VLGRLGSLTVPHWVWTLVDVPLVAAAMTAAVLTAVRTEASSPPLQAASRVAASAMAVRRDAGLSLLKESTAVMCALLEG
jgi:hypothetical protein